MTGDTFDMLTIGLAQNLGLAAFVVLAYSILGQRLDRLASRNAQIAHGALFGLSGIFCMLMPIMVADGVYIDGRTVVVALSAFFGGPLAALVAGAIAAGYRVWMGGAGAFGGAVAIAVVAFTAIWMKKRCTGGGRPLRHLHLVKLGAAVSVTSSVGLLMLPKWEVTVALFQTNGLAYAVMNFIGPVLLGTLLLQEKRRQKAEQALIESKVRFSDLITGSAQGILIHHNFKPLFVNAAYARIYGYDSPAEIMALPSLLCVVPPGDRPFASEILRRIGDGRLNNFISRVENIRRDGSSIWVEMLDRQVEWEGALANQVTVVDVTQRKEAEDALAEQTQELADLAANLETARYEAEQARIAAEAANHAKSDFLATMSHELRTPLNSILGFSELIRDQHLGEIGIRQYAEYAGHVHDSGHFLLALINDILDVAKIESGRMAIDPSPLDLRQTIRACVNLVGIRAMEEGIDLRIDVPSGFAPFHADERAVKQILFNLLSNAVRFTPRGGSVVVSARRNQDFGVTLAVRDTGAGIPAEHVARLFQRFEQVDNSYGGAKGGSGLGLVLVKGLAELHGGRVHVESTVGQGTTVTLSFPQEAMKQVAS